MPQSHGYSKRKKRQRAKMHYSMVREDAQLKGLIPTTPEGAIWEERVAPASQGSHIKQLPALIQQAIRECWAIPDEAKQQIVRELLIPFYERNPDTSKHLLIKLARTLLMLDQTQYERDKLVEALARRNAVEAVAALREMVKPEE